MENAPKKTKVFIEGDGLQPAIVYDKKLYPEYQPPDGAMDYMLTAANKFIKTYKGKGIREATYSNYPTYPFLSEYKGRYNSIGKKKLPYVKELKQRVYKTLLYPKRRMYGYKRAWPRTTWQPSAKNSKYRRMSWNSSNQTWRQYWWNN